MHTYKESGKFKYSDLIITLITGSATAFLIAIIFFYFIKFTGFNILIIFPIIEVVILYFIILKVLSKRHIRNMKVLLFFGIIFGLILYITPHAITYNEINNEITDYYTSLGIEKPTFGITEYIQLRSSWGASIKRFFSKTQDWGTPGFYLLEIMDLFFLLGGAIYIMYTEGKKPYSEKHQKYYTEKVSTKVIPLYFFKEIKKKIRKNPIFHEVKEAFITDYTKHNLKLNKEVKTIEITTTPEKNEFAVEVSGDHYILTPTETTEIKKILR